MRRIRFVLLCAGVALVSAAAALLWLLLRETPFITVILKSEPSQATVFTGEQTLGTTPLSLKITRGRKLSLHLVRKDCKDAEVEVKAADYAMPTVAQRLRLKSPSPPYERTAVLESTTDAELIVKVEPAGTEVFLDGHQLGVAPLAPARVTPGSHTLRLTHPECFTLTENVSVNPGVPLVVERKLENKVVAFYREQMRKEPLILVHAAELAHHHVLRGQFAEAAQALRDGMPNLTKAEAYQQQKYFEEIVRFYTNYYVYPKGDDAALRKTCRELMAEAQEKKIGNQQQLATYIKQLDAHDKAHPPQ